MIEDHPEFWTLNVKTSLYEREKYGVTYNIKLTFACGVRIKYQESRTSDIMMTICFAKELAFAELIIHV